VNYLNELEGSCLLAELLVAGVFGHLGLHVVGNTPLQGRVDESVVVACSVDVQIEEVVDVLDIPARHLHHRQADDLVVGRSEPFPVHVLEIALLDLQVKVDSEGAEMGDLLRHISIEVVLLFLIGVGLGPSVLDEVVVDPILERDGVGNGGLLALVDGVEDLEDLPADQFVVAVDEEADLVGLAVLGDGHVDVWDCGHLLLIGNQDHLVGQVFVLLEEVLDEGGGVVAGGVVDDHHPVVAVVLVEDRLQVVLVPEVLGVVEAGHHDAEGQLGGVVAVVVGLLQTGLLLQQLLLDLPPLERVDERGLDVGPLHHPGVALLLGLEVVALHQLVELFVLGVPDDLLRVVLQQID
jgi:hypothetical protein